MSDSISSSSTSNSTTKTTDCLKIIVLGDSAVGKSKLLERFLVNS
jgi:GTPase SAR1 family protein